MVHSLCVVSERWGALFVGKTDQTPIRVRPGTNWSISDATRKKGSQITAQVENDLWAATACPNACPVCVPFSHREQDSIRSAPRFTAPDPWEHPHSNNRRMQPDAASRPQDQAHFGTQTYPNAISIYWGAAADAQLVGCQETSFTKDEIVPNSIMDTSW